MKKYTKRKTCKFLKKPKGIVEVPVNGTINPPMIRQWVFGEKPKVLSRNRMKRFEELAALHETECLWCTARECMVAAQVCFHTCVKKDHCRRYQNYMNGCDKDGNSLL